MLCGVISSDDEDKWRDNLTGNCIFNIQNLTANVEKVWRVTMCIE